MQTFSKRYSVLILSVAVFVGCMASALLAQGEGDETVEPEVLTEPEAPVELTELEQCQSSKNRLATLYIELQRVSAEEIDSCRSGNSEQVAALAVRIQACRDDHQLSRRTNIALNDDLERCRSEPTHADENAVAELEAANAELATSQANLAQSRALVSQLEMDLAQSALEFAELRKRLEELGFSERAEFYYFQRDAAMSFMRVSDFRSIIAQDDMLNGEQCPDALDWLNGQTERNALPFDILIWVADADGIALCLRDGDGNPTRRPASPTDEAHLVLFQ